VCIYRPSFPLPPFPLRPLFSIYFSLFLCYSLSFFYLSIFVAPFPLLFFIPRFFLLLPSTFLSSVVALLLSFPNLFSYSFISFARHVFYPAFSSTQLYIIVLVATVDSLGIPLRILVTACMRMRNLGKGQSVAFCIPAEIQTKILAISGKNDATTIDVSDVLVWSIHETYVNLQRSMPLWAAQGTRFLR